MTRHQPVRAHKITQVTYFQHPRIGNEEDGNPENALLMVYFHKEDAIVLFLPC